MKLLGKDSDVLLNKVQIEMTNRELLTIAIILGCSNKSSNEFRGAASSGFTYIRKHVLNQLFENQNFDAQKVYSEISSIIENINDIGVA